MDNDLIARLRDMPIEMPIQERVLFYTLLYGLKPLKYLEIGSSRGGSAMVVQEAMAAADVNGSITCIDITFDKILPETRRRLESRTRFIKGDSLKVLPDLVLKEPRSFDVILVDGRHDHPVVDRDIELSIQLLTDDAYLFMHDCYSPPTKEAIRQAFKEYNTNNQALLDCGNLMRHPVYEKFTGRLWCGMHLAHFKRLRD